MANDIYDVIVMGVGPGSEMTTFLTFGLGIGAAVVMARGLATVSDAIVGGASLADIRIGAGVLSDAIVGGATVEVSQ